MIEPSTPTAWRRAFMYHAMTWMVAVQEDDRSQRDVDARWRRPLCAMISPASKGITTRTAYPGLVALVAAEFAPALRVADRSTAAVTAKPSATMSASRWRGRPTTTATLTIAAQAKLGELPGSGRRSCRATNVSSGLVAPQAAQ